MTQKEQLLTTSEFAKKVGISASTVRKLINEKKIKAAKKSGKWMINPGQLKSKSVLELSKGKKPSPKKKPAKKPRKKAAATAAKAAAGPEQTAAPKEKSAPRSGKAFSVAEFAEMTYLTETGVMQWLRQGLLEGRQDANGNWQVDASNLEVPNVKRLIR